MKNFFLIGLLLTMLLVSSCSLKSDAPFEGDVLEAFKSALEKNDLRTFKKINHIELNSPYSSSSKDAYNKVYAREQAKFSFLSEKKLIDYSSKRYPIPDYDFYSFAFGTGDVFDTYAEIGIDKDLNKMSFVEFDTGLSGSIKESILVLQIEAGFFNSLGGPSYRTFYFIPESENITQATLYCSDKPRTTYTPRRISLIDCAGSALSDDCSMGSYNVRERYVWKFEFSRLPECDVLYILDVATDSNKEYTFAAKIFR